MGNKKEIRSSTAEYLTFVAATGEQSNSTQMRYEDENIWLTQKMMAELYDVSVSAINQHIKKIFDDEELDEKAVMFRKWANAIVKDYTIQGWAMDTERLKKGGTILDKDYFEKQLEKIREIRLSERRFFAAVQNKMHFSIHGKTAAELI